MKLNKRQNVIRHKSNRLYTLLYHDKNEIVQIETSVCPINYKEYKESLNSLPKP